MVSGTRQSVECLFTLDKKDNIEESELRLRLSDGGIYVTIMPAKSKRQGDFRQAKAYNAYSQPLATVHSILRFKVDLRFNYERI